MSPRTFELHTASHGPDDLWIARLRGCESLSSLYRFDLVVIASEPNLEEVLLGQRATLRMRSPGSERTIHGIIARTSAHPRFRHMEGASLRVRIVPRMWTLGLGQRSRIFQDLTVPEIVDEVLGASEIPTRWSLAREHAARPYCVQHRESDLGFVQRLLAEEGIFSFFEPLEDDDRLVLADSAHGYDPLPGEIAVPFRPDRERATTEHLNKLDWARKLRPRALLRTAFDERRPHDDLRAEAQRPATVASGTIHHHELAWDGFRTGEEAAQVELERARRSADVVEAEGSLLRAMPGLRFDAFDAPTSTLDRGLAIVAVETTGWQPIVGVAAPSPESSRTPLHTCKLVCVPDDVAHRPPLRPRPSVGGLETATVMGPQVAATVSDIMAAVSMVAPHTVGEARTLPLPILLAGRPAVIVLHFAQPALARKDLLYAPHQMTVVDLENRTVIEHAPCSPADLGVSDLPRRRFTSFGLGHVPDDVFWRSRDEVSRRAPMVWRDFFAHHAHDKGDDEEGRARRATFLAAFERCTYAPLLPYLRGAAPKFFAWLEGPPDTDTGARPPSRRAPQVTPV